MPIATIDWKPFSDKHIDYINNAYDSDFAVAEGAIRSGKTIDNCLVFCAKVEESPDRIFLASGSTIANAKMNIGECNGYGLEYLFRGRCRWGKFKDNEALYLYTATGEKIVIFAGGGKSDSYKKILGNSYGGWIATEINEHYDCDNSKESFIKVARGRLVASQKPFVLWDLNPSDPRHRIYREYIDLYRNEKRKGYVYEHFTIDDNLSVSSERKEQLKSDYGTPNSVWYRRDILGERCTAEGLCFQEYADDPAKYEVEFASVKSSIVKVNIGVDFGGNKSKTAFVATGFSNGLKGVFPICSERKHMKNSEDLKEKFSAFVQKVYNACGRAIDVYCDSAEQTLIGDIKLAVARQGLPVVVHNALKGSIKERIRLVNKLFSQKRLHFCEDTETLKQALREAVFDPKKIDDERLDDGSTDIDSCDAFEYTVEPVAPQLRYI